MENDSAVTIRRTIGAWYRVRAAWHGRVASQRRGQDVLIMAVQVAMDYAGQTQGLPALKQHSR
jgi:hypothetical protein